MGVPLVMEILTERAHFMRESLKKSQTITDGMVSILGSFDHRLSALETAMRPTQVRTHAIRKAHENIDKTLKAAEIILAQFDISRQGLETPEQFRQAEETVLKLNSDGLLIGGDDSNTNACLLAETFRETNLKNIGDWLSKNNR